MDHVVLLGDSIFDNSSYALEGFSIIEQVRSKLPKKSQATLLAVDGDFILDVNKQISKMPVDATRLFISCGGNDALGYSGVLHEPANSVAEVLERFADIRMQFQSDYRQMLKQVLSLGKPTIVCTIYETIPDLGRVAITALSMFNDVILREAFLAQVPVIDLRLVCNETSDYSEISSIEPSTSGGEKIARAIVNTLNHDPAKGKIIIYT